MKKERIIQSLYNFKSLANETIIESDKDNIYKLSLNRSNNDYMLYIGVTLINKETTFLEYCSYKAKIFINKKEQRNNIKIYSQFGDLKKEYIKVIRDYMHKIESLLKMVIDYIEFIIIYEN